jgi:hypothetical protein
MIERMPLVFGASVAFLLSACAARVPPTAKAAQVEEAQCSNAAAPDDMRVLEASRVLRADPIYSEMHSSTTDYELVSGATLQVSVPEGVSADRLTHILQCHSAAVLLGQVDRSKFAEDPTWLPNAWLDIDVKPAGGHLAVTLSANTVAKNLQVLHRATAFADGHRSWTVQ